MRNVEFNIHWRDIEGWAWEEITVRIGYTPYTHFEEILTWCSGEVREFHFSALGKLCEWWARTMRKRAYRLVDVCEELAGRELNDIIESGGFRDDWTAISQLCEAWLMTRISFDHTSSITNVLIVALTNETHFEEGSTEWTGHQIVVDWKSIGSNYHKYLERHEKNYDSRAKDCQVHAVRGSRASCQRRLKCWI